jgi:hypothetical protein
MSATDETVNVRQAAMLLGIKPSTVRVLIHNRKLAVDPGSSSRNENRILRSEIERYKRVRSNPQALAKAPAQKLIARYDGICPPHIEPVAWEVVRTYAAIARTLDVSHEAVRQLIIITTAEVYRDATKH